MTVNPKKKAQSEVYLEENSNIIRTFGVHEEAFQEATTLRHKVFCEQLGWLPENSEKVEADRYDDYAVHFGVFDSHTQHLVGYARVVLPEPLGFMIKNEMKKLLPSGAIPSPIDETIEVTRLVIRDKQQKNSKESFQTRNNVYKGIYHWSKLHKKNYWLAAVRERMFRLLRAHHFKFQQIGDTVEFQEDIPTVAALMDLRETEKAFKNRRPERLSWFQEGLPSHLTISATSLT